MNNLERISAIFNYKSYDRLPIVHFGFWRETLEKWAQEGHITKEQALGWTDSTPIDRSIGEKLGFDFNWYSVFHTYNDLYPIFEPKIIEQFPDGSRHKLQYDGVVVLERPGAGSIPSEVSHTLKDRKSWEEHYLPRLQFSPDRIENALVNTGQEMIAWNKGGLEFLCNSNRPYHQGLMCGSLFGQIRNWLGVENSIYLYMDDEPLFKEIIDTSADLRCQCVKYVLEKGAKFDFAHFWEDICFKNGPLIDPNIFSKYVGPHYKKISQLVNSYGIDIVSVDCDGLIDSLIPVWFENGVNTMFPIEVGTWNASIKPWREKYGKQIRGVGGMNKVVFAYDYAAIDAEIERLKPLIELGGYIPCPDHRIAPDAKWENVQYYCEKLHQINLKYNKEF